MVRIWPSWNPYRYWMAPEPMGTETSRTRHSIARLTSGTILLLIAQACFVPSVLAHSGRTDGCGGHHDRRAGRYHVHDPGLAEDCEEIRVRVGRVTTRDDWIGNARVIASISAPLTIRNEGKQYFPDAEVTCVAKHGLRKVVGTREFWLGAALSPRVAVDTEIEIGIDRKADSIDCWISSLRRIGR